MIPDYSQYSELAFQTDQHIQRIQSGQLLQHIKYCRENSPFYKKMKELGSLKGNYHIPVRLEDIPFTEKEDIEQSNDSFRAVPMEKIVDIVMSSGTTGKATRIMYTENDLKRLAYNEAQSFFSMGMNRDDIVLLTCTMDRCFVAGLAYFSGLRSMGAATIRNGHGTMESHLEMIRLHQPTAIIGVPSFVRKLGGFLKSEGIDPADTSVNKIICIGEPLRNRQMQLLMGADEIESVWKARVYSTYASSETVTTFCECTAQNGGHLHPELAFIEIVDEKGKVLSHGETGEIVITPLAVEGMPLIRYKTGDISFTMNEPCSCGRKSLRLGPIIGRKKQMLKVKGTTLYPQAVFSLLSEMDNVIDYYLEVKQTEDLSDDLYVHVSVKGETLYPEQLRKKLQARLRFAPHVVIDEPEALRRIVYTEKSRKPVRFVDKRNK